MKQVLADSRWWVWLGVQRQTVDRHERVRLVLGAVLGLWLAGGLVWLGGGGASSLWLAAPMGASAVLLFAVPSSPLAQPWPMLVGNVMSALVGVAMVRWLGPTPAAAALAGGLALALMFPLRCVHPPGGAVAITAVLGNGAVHELGFGFAFMPVAVNSAILLAVALAWRHLTEPAATHPPAVHRSRHRTTDHVPQDRVGTTRADLDAALEEANQLVDIDRDALEDLLRRAQLHAWKRRFGVVRCADIMSRDLVTVEFATPLDEAWGLLHRHHLHALPVVDRARRVIGMLTQADFLRHAQLDPRDHLSLGLRIRQLLTPSPGMTSTKAEVVGQIMKYPVQTATEDEPAVELVSRLSDEGLHHVPVLDGQRRLSGMVTQSDLLAALYRSQVGPRPDGI